MLLKLFLAFTIIPVVEIYLLIQIGSAFGVFTSIALVVFTGFLGAYLARIQGLQTIFRIQESLREGRMPSGELLDALLIGVAGLVLLTPGFLTDTVGFVLLIPSTRNAIKSWLQSNIKTQYMSERPEDTIIEQ
ncbi:MAG: FxsA family protein [SAR324 cluster bacterium]|nr:FxsA family protein [SAR324 cluster bacterium]MEC8981658.1 FxsA family protein [SAR324 cluster bacterium]MEC9383031.1 FxsA family protein [SAR324 cluster bacterium]MED5403109.1 FxsA family protein [SAR324 cluster bacterium]MED5482878.1 FxsA family protein [SAR324 cluster bacterium]